MFALQGKRTEEGKNTARRNKKDKHFHQNRRSQNIKCRKLLIAHGGMLNQLPQNVFHSLQTDFLDNDRDRLALVCSGGDRYRGLGGDAVASLRAGRCVSKTVGSRRS